MEKESRSRILATLYGTQQWEALIDLMNEEQRTAEEAHMALYGNELQFGRSGLVAVATKLFNEAIQSQIAIASQQVVDEHETKRLKKSIQEFHKLRSFQEVAKVI